MTAWQGFLAPALTPKTIVDLLAREIQRIAQETAIIDKLSSVGVDAISTSPAQLVDMIRNEQAIYAKAVKAAGLKTN